MMQLMTEDLWFSYGSAPVLKGVTIAEAAPGMVTAIIGPNAAGKSTLLKCIAGLLKPRGKVLLDGQDVRRLKRAKFTRDVSYLPQDIQANAVLTVFEAVLLARQGVASWRVSDDDLVPVAEVLEKLAIEELALRYLNELSGGQKQMVSIAQSLVRGPKVLLLDEPTSRLDLQHQLEVLDLIKTVTLEREITTLVAMHDLNLAARYADGFVILSDGTVYASGNPGSVLTPEMLRDVYGVHATVRFDGDAIPQVTPISSVRREMSSLP